MTEKKIVEEQETSLTVFPENPEQAMIKAQEIVQLMSGKVKGFISKIQGKDYPKVEWWTTVGATLSLSPYVLPDSVKPILKNDQIIGYHARAEVRDIRFNPPKTITAAEAMCTKEENNWKNRDEHALKSMAQTRAVSKAYRLGFSFLAVLAGLQPTPAEEMDFDNGNNNPKTKKKTSKTNNFSADKLKKEMYSYLKKITKNPDEIPSIIEKWTDKRFSNLHQLTDAQVQILYKKHEKEITGGTK